VRERDSFFGCSGRVKEKENDRLIGDGTLKLAV
jgi:hypothetical protein